MPASVRFSRRSFMLMPMALAACKSGDDAIRLSGQTMGTTYHVVAVTAGLSLEDTDLQVAVSRALAEVNQQMSNWDPQSEISRFNARDNREATALSRPLAEVMQAAQYVHHASLGRFDTTMGPLIELWGFGAQGSHQMPAEAAIADALGRVGHENTLRVGTDSLQKSHPDAQVYLAAIGKGYGADHVGRALEALGITDYMVEIGGDLYAAGRNPEGLRWQIGIEKPDARDRSVLNVIAVSGYGLASSGDYRNYFERDGQRYSHVIDPATGYPITHQTASATVLAKNSMLADAWATAMLTLGREKGLEVAETEGLAVQFIERDTSAATLQFTTTTSSEFKVLTA